MKIIEHVYVLSPPFLYSTDACEPRLPLLLPRSSWHRNSRTTKTKCGALQRLTVLGEKEQAALTNTAHKCSMWEIFEAGGEQNPPSGEIDADFGARRSK